MIVMLLDVCGPCRLLCSLHTGDVPLDPSLKLQHTPLIDRALHYYNVELHSISLGDMLLGVTMVRRLLACLLVLPVALPALLLVLALVDVLACRQQCAAHQAWQTHGVCHGALHNCAECDSINC